MLFIGDDWAEAHHDIEIEDDFGQVLARRTATRGDGRDHGVARVGRGASRPDGEQDQVLVGIETDRGPWVQALLASGDTVYAINPMQVARYRERHSTSGAKSDPGCASVG